MKLGMCSGINFKDYINHPCEKLEEIFEIGYDFIEINLSQLASLSKEQFDIVLNWQKETSASILAGNILFSQGFELVGNNVDFKKIENFLNLVIERAALIGVKTVVFGSGKAKDVPGNFEREKAVDQLLVSIGLMDKIAKRNNIIIAIEPLNSKECNIINSVGEALWYVKKINSNNVKLLADIYHIYQDNQPFKLTIEEYQNLAHVHFCEPKGRVYAKKVTKATKEFADALLDSGYDGLVSTEGVYSDFDIEPAKNLSVMKELFIK